MGIDQIVRIAPGHGTPVVPELGDYASASPGWSEVEHRGPQPLDSLVGFWEGQPGSVALRPWPYPELCILLTGRVSLVDDDGGRMEFGAGEAFFVPETFSGTWETLEPTTKVFVGFGALAGS